MRFSMGNKHPRSGPKRRQKHYSYDEALNEAPQLLEDEAVNIEQELPVEENEPVEHIEETEESPSSVFEEGPPTHDGPCE